MYVKLIIISCICLSVGGSYAQNGVITVSKKTDSVTTLNDFGKLFYKAFITQNLDTLSNSISTKAELKEVTSTITDSTLRAVLNKEYFGKNDYDTIRKKFDKQFNTQYKIGIPDGETPVLSIFSKSASF